MIAAIEERIKNERFIAIGEFSARIAHDMKNPLNVILASSSIMNNILDNDVVKKETCRINRNVKRISNQINEILHYVGTRPLVCKVTSIRNIIDSSLDSLNIPNNIEIKINVKDVKIYCDEEKLAIVCINIILNAVQAIGDQKGVIEIRSSELIDGNVSIEIENDGPPISSKVLPKIFDPLFTTKQSGTGLGLSGVKTIVEQHNGMIIVNPNPVVFKIIIPNILKHF
jgi:signal transduction histidine kinase